jgi:hypothetical protein
LINLLLKHHDGVVERLLGSNGGQTPQLDQQFTVSGDHEHRPKGLRQRET